MRVLLSAAFTLFWASFPDVEIFNPLTLADFLKTPTEVRNSFNDLSALLTSLGSSSGLTAENLEKIISDYPQLIGDLGDTHKLATGIIKNMEAYKELYKNNLVDSCWIILLFWFITRKLLIKWSYNQRKYYEEKGYIFTKYGEDFEVNFEDLPHSSDRFIDVQCDYCGKIFSTRIKKIL